MIASVILLTKNAGPEFEAVLSALLHQETGFDYEVIAIDSGSTDGTLDLLTRRGIGVRHIPPGQFGFGRARNLGVGLARGRHAVFLSQDATPAAATWLRTLVDRLDDPAIAAVCGRQLPKPATNPVERYFLNDVYPPVARLYGPADAGRFVTFSNVNCAIRADLLREIPFDETLLMSEDQAWAQAALGAGRAILYDPEPAVFHAHGYSWRGIFRRSFDSGATLRHILPRAGSLVPSRGFSYAAKQMRSLIANREWAWIPYAGLYEACRVAGYLTGLLDSRLPRPISRRLRRYGDLLDIPEAEPT